MCIVYACFVAGALVCFAVLDRAITGQPSVLLLKGARRTRLGTASHTYRTPATPPPHVSRRPARCSSMPNMCAPNRGDQNYIFGGTANRSTQSLKRGRGPCAVEFSRMPQPQPARGRGESDGVKSLDTGNSYYCAVRRGELPPLAAWP